MPAKRIASGGLFGTVILIDWFAALMKDTVD
jgi:hypothetical protein